MQITGVHIETLHNPTRYSYRQIERAFLPPAGDGGTVVNVTLSPHHGLAGMTHSSAARAAVEGYTRALADEWAERGIAVVAIAAGHYDTASLRHTPSGYLRSDAVSKCPAATAITAIPCSAHASACARV